MMSHENGAHHHRNDINTIVNAMTNEIDIRILKNQIRHQKRAVIGAMFMTVAWINIIVMTDDAIMIAKENIENIQNRLWIETGTTIGPHQKAHIRHVHHHRDNRIIRLHPNAVNRQCIGAIALIHADHALNH